jgi:hypothetical protein
MARYQVFTQRGATVPKFSAPWYWLAFTYQTYFCGNSDRCRIVDSKLNKPMMEWGRATRVKSRSGE